MSNLYIFINIYMYLNGKHIHFALTNQIKADIESAIMLAEI